ncbi:hypothetical protein WR25_22926 [Diploscapter pachys]|uniref:Uncharacterized protein n=1 Tax=Diploscapter pachys TaxID=2018661 RepID=A0A2A2JZ47_9BILA|nr:hypothetical protein WR25_22926 [Diploscapter pachys]
MTGGLISPQPSPGEPRPLQAAADRGRAAHDAPHALVAGVRDGAGDRTLVDAQVIARHPAALRVDRPRLQLNVGIAERGVEAVEEAVFAIQVRPALHRIGRRYANLGREGEAAQRRGRRDRTVVALVGLAERASGGIAEELRGPPLERQLKVAGAVAGGQAPDVARITVPVHRIGDAIGPIGIGRAAAVLEIIEAGGPHRLIANAAEVDPHLAVLMAEQRREGEVPRVPLPAPEGGIALRPGVPRPVGKRPAAAAEADDIDHHPLVIPVPRALDEALAGMPAHRHGAARIGEPRPVGPIGDQFGKPADLRLHRIGLIVPGTGEQDAEEQQRRVDAGQFGVAIALPGFHIEEVVEEALVPGHAGRRIALRRSREEAQRRQCQVAGFLARDPATLHADRIGRQREADRGDTGEGRRRPAIGHQPVLAIGEVPEIAEGALFEVAEPCRQRGCGRGGQRVAGQRARGGGKRRMAQQRAAIERQGHDVRASVVVRMTRSVATTCVSGVSVPPCSASISRATARAPISASGTRMVVRPRYRARGMSSKPVTATSPGTDRPCSRKAASTPSAIMSLAATMPSKATPRARSMATAAAPESSRKSPSITTGSMSGAWRAIALRRHDDQPVDAPAHRSHRLRRQFGIGVHIGQQQMIAARADLTVHAAHDFGKELAVQVGQHHADRMAARQRQAARAGVRHIAQRLGRREYARARIGMDTAMAVQSTRDRCDRYFSDLRDVADRGRCRLQPLSSPCRPLAANDHPCVNRHVLYRTPGLCNRADAGR